MQHVGKMSLRLNLDILLCEIIGEGLRIRYVVFESNVMIEQIM